MHVRCRFQPLPTKLVFAYFDRGSCIVMGSVGIHQYWLVIISLYKLEALLFLVQRRPQLFGEASQQTLVHRSFKTSKRNNNNKKLGTSPTPLNPIYYFFEGVQHFWTKSHSLIHLVSDSVFQTQTFLEVDVVFSPSQNVIIKQSAFL